MGGRSSVSGLSVTVFGATGFTGRYLINKLGQIGSRIVIPYRGNEGDMMHLKPMADLGQIYPLRFHLKDEDSIRDCIKDSDVVVNLIGQDRNSRLVDANVEGSRRLAKISREAGVRKFIHVSSLMSSPTSASAFQKSKFEGELAVKEEFGRATIVRPSCMFGYEDRLLNMIGLFSAIPLGYPVAKHGKATRNPLYVGDFAEALLRFCKDKNASYDEKTFDLIGPESLSFRQLIEFFIKHTFRVHPIINVPPWLLFIYARMFPEWRRPVLTIDGVRELSIDEPSVKAQGHLGFEDLGITKLQTLNDMALGFVRGFRPVYAYPRPL